MLYSTIEEAWRPPMVVREGFTSDDKCECEKLIQQIMQCPGCLEKVLAKTSNDTVKSLMDTIMENRETIRRVLFATAAVLIVILLFLP